MFIIDWDEAILAPRERDLMFVLEYASRATKAGNNPTDLFFEGYGNTEVKQLVHTYYRYEWVVQDLGGYGESVFYISEFGDVTKRDAVQRIKGMFAPGGVVNTAYEADVKLASG
jgi:spectinomycin phosphotransferase